MALPHLRLRASPAARVLALYAALLLLAASALPWWRMENRAPQYGMRVLVIQVSPRGVEGDVKEIDGLGHYVGILPMANFAPFERAAAPYLVGATMLLALSLPFLRPGKWRTLAGLAVIAVPAGFVLDLWAWQRWAVTHLDPDAPMSMIADRVDARVIGRYTVAQFRVDATFEAGFWLAVVASANVAAFLLVERKRRGPATAPATTSAPLSAAAAGAALLLLAATASADTLEVGPRSEFRTISSAVSAAESGDEVVVRAGTYREHVVVDRPLLLRGEGAVVVDGGGRGTVVLVQRGPSTVRGLTIRGSGTSLLAEDAGVKVLDAADCVVEDCVVEDTLFGVMARSSPRVRVARTHVVGKDLQVERRGDGIRVQDSNGSVVEDNSVSRSRDLAIWQSNGCVVRGNTVTDSRYGLHYMYCDDNLFEGNDFSGNHTGAAVMYSRRVTLRGNRFAGSRGPSAHGLLLKTADDVVIEDNRIVDNTRGLFVDGAPSSRIGTCTVRGNVIAGNDVGVTLQPSAARVVFTENVFAANRVAVEAFGRQGPDQNVWTAGGRGNYWGDHVGFDADGDGVIDTPYRLEQFVEDLAARWPAVGLLRGSPAAGALESAARAFPILAPRPTLIDERPLAAPPAALAHGASTSPRWGLAIAGLAAASGAATVVAFARREPRGGRS